MVEKSVAGSGTLGPVELNLVTLPDGAAAPDVIAALVQQVRAGVIRVVDFVTVKKTDSGVVEIQELELDAGGLEDLNVELVVPGLTSNEDIDLLAADLEPGAAAAIVAFELVWARDLAHRLAASGAEVVAVERIPATIVNEIVAMDEAELQTGE
ncbi:DUF6325 family protein [Gordonia sp. (in: high G+C Gram-positive bacteria)]|uniref:DUF6325 family protein n=1 Tax=Gordonia sp. (in: high G+C Gram-positive bacteria) TaxID=84139 RepID=UPI003C71EB0F